MFVFIVQGLGLLLITAVIVRGGLTVYSIVNFRIKESKAQKKHLEIFKSLVTKAPKQITHASQKQNTAWKGKRKFRVIKRVYETPNKDICSFYLVPYDNNPIPPYLPGQFLTFELPNQSGRPKRRCYSLSDSPTEKRYYRISVKRMAPPANTPEVPPGLFSSTFHDNLFEGDIIEVFAPSGEFYLKQNSQRPVVLIAGGVGITPLLSMLNWLVHTRSQREIWLFNAVRNRQHHAMYDHLQWIKKNCPNVRIVSFYSEPTPSCQKQVDFDIEGYVTVDVLKHFLKARNYQFYMCGPGPMMQQLSGDLKNWGVPAADIMTERFGPAAPKKKSANGKANGKEAVFTIDFARSKKRIQWTEKSGSILDVAEENDIKAQFNCRGGSCGTCKTRILNGEVEYDEEPDLDPGRGSCLICVANPKSNVVLDL